MLPSVSSSEKPIISFFGEKKNGLLIFTGLDNVKTRFKVTKETKKKGFKGAIQSFFNNYISRKTHLTIEGKIYGIKKEILEGIKEEYKNSLTIRNLDAEYLKNESINETIIKILRIANNIQSPQNPEEFSDVPLDD
jgi:hypothetical protein